MSAEITGDVFYLDMDARKKFVLAVLADNANETGLCWPSQDTIALKASTTPRHCRGMLHQLERVGYITIVQRGVGRGNVTNYLLNVDRIKQEADARREAVKAQKEEIRSEKRKLVPLYENLKEEIHDTKEEIHDTKEEIHDTKEEPSSPRTIKEPLLEPSKEPSGEPWRPPQEFSPAFKVLWDIPGCVPDTDRDQGLVDFWQENEIPPAMALNAATALSAEWPGPKKKPYKDARKTVRNWSLNRMQWAAERANGSRASPNGRATRREADYSDLERYNH